MATLGVSSLNVGYLAEIREGIWLPVQEAARNPNKDIIEVSALRSYVFYVFPIKTFAWASR